MDRSTAAYTDRTDAPAPLLGPRSGPARVATVVGLVALAVLGASLSGPWSPPVRERGAPPEEPTPTPEPVPLPTAEPDPFLEGLRQLDQTPMSLGWVWGLLAVLLSVAVGYLVLRVLLRSRGVGPEGTLPPLLPGPSAPGDVPPDLTALREGVDDAAEHLGEQHRLPADAVIAAWVTLEEAAERSGVPRAPSATPTEFTVAVLDKTPADPAAVRSLLGLYLRARFGAEPLTREDVVTATAAVRTLADGLQEDR